MSPADLARFIADRLDEHEQGARAALDKPDRIGDRWWSVHRQLLDANGSRSDGSRPIGNTESSWMAEHIARHDPAHVLAFVAAGRAILALHKMVPYLQGWPVCAACVDWDEQPAYEPPPMEKAPCPTVRAFGTIWAGHPAWREEWRA